MRSLSSVLRCASDARSIIGARLSSVRSVRTPSSATDDGGRRTGNGTEALRALSTPEATSFVPDAILLDLNTPRSDGFQVLIQLTQSPRLSQVPIAIITSSKAGSDKHRAALQSVRFIQKPTHLEEFLATVGRAVKEMLHV